MLFYRNAVEIKKQGVLKNAMLRPTIGHCARSLFREVNMKNKLLILGIALVMSAGLGAASSPETLENSKPVQKACKADYKKLCRKVKKGNGRIIKCLQENSAQLSPACKTALSQ